MVVQETLEPYSVPNRGPVPRIEKEEGLKPGEVKILRLEKWRLSDVKWTKGLQWHERLHNHFTMSSARRHFLYKRPFEPRDELDFVMEAAYCPQKEVFSEKTDPYLHIETVYGEKPRYQRNKFKSQDVNQFVLGLSQRRSMKRLESEPEEKESWRVLKNRIVIYPHKNIPRSHPIVRSNGGESRRGNIYNVKLGIPADHSSHSNPGYSRTPSGAFYCI